MTTNQSKKFTAKDLAQRLANDANYQEIVKSRDDEIAKNVAMLRAAESGIVSDLRAAGCEVGSVWDLVNTAKPYPEALPILIAHLERGGYPDRVMESLGRALAVKPSIAYWTTLREKWMNARTPGEADGVAVALAACATKAQVDDLISFLDVTQRGETRVYFLRPILHLGGDRGRRIVKEKRFDPDFAREATALLRHDSHRS